MAHGKPPLQMVSVGHLYRKPSEQYDLRGARRCRKRRSGGAGGRAWQQAWLGAQEGRRGGRVARACLAGGGRGQARSLHASAQSVWAGRPSRGPAHLKSMQVLFLTVQAWSSGGGADLQGASPALPWHQPFRGHVTVTPSCTHGSGVRAGEVVGRHVQEAWPGTGPAALGQRRHGTEAGRAGRQAAGHRRAGAVGRRASRCIALRGTAGRQAGGSQPQAHAPGSSAARRCTGSLRRAPGRAAAHCRRCKASRGRLERSRCTWCRRGTRSTRRLQAVAGGGAAGLRVGGACGWGWCACRGAWARRGSAGMTSRRTARQPAPHAPVQRSRWCEHSG